MNNNMILFNSHATISSTATFNAYRIDNHFGMESTGANVAGMYFKSDVNHIDAADVVALTIVNGDDNVDQTNRIAAMDAMVSKLNTVNKAGFVMAFSEIENVKPGGIASIAVTLDT